MHVPTKARLAVAAVAASAVSMGVAAPSFAATGSIAKPALGTTVGVKTPVTVTITNPNIAGKPNTRTITWSLPAGAPVPTGSWSVNFHDASGSGTSIGKITVPAATLTVNHDFVLGTGITYDTFSVSVSASDKVSGNTWSGTAPVTIGTPAKGGAVAPTVSVAPGLSVAVGQQITATAINGAVAPGGDMKYDFDFGDPLKTPSNTQVIIPGTDAAKTGTAMYTYTAAGTYTLRVTTTDGTNKAVSTPVVINVGGGTPPPPPPGTGPAVQRLAGTNRYDTGVVISKNAFANSSVKDVIVATAAKFPDALSGVPLAKHYGAPMLLVDPTDTAATGNNAEVKAEIARVLQAGGMVHVLGGTAAVPDALMTALTPAGSTNERISGANRYGTSLAIANKLGNPKNIVVARGDDGTNYNGFADALSAGPFAANVFGGGNGAVLLSDNTNLDPGVKSYLTTATSIVGVGGPAANALTSAGLANVQAGIIGNDRYQTAAMVAGQFTGAKTAGVAYGLKFPDALTGASYLAVKDGPLLLTDTNAVSPYTTAALAGIGSALGSTGVISVFGGTAVISETTRTTIATAAGGHAV